MRFAVENVLTDAVAAIFLHDRKPQRITVSLAGDADVVESVAGAHDFNRFPHGFPAGFRQAVPRNRGFADFKHAGIVAVKVVFVDDRDVDVGDVARLQNLLLGRNAVANDVIY